MQVCFCVEAAAQTSEAGPHSLLAVPVVTLLGLWQAILHAPPPPSHSKAPPLVAFNRASLSVTRTSGSGFLWTMAHCRLGPSQGT